MNSVNYM